MKAPRDKVQHQLAIAKGQIEGIGKMVEQDAYCLDISNQLMATIALLKNLNCLILESHLEHCLAHAEGPEKEEKIKEIVSVLKRLS